MSPLGLRRPGLLRSGVGIHRVHGYEITRLIGTDEYGVIPVDCRVEIDVSEELAASMIMVGQFKRRHIPEVQDRDLLDFFYSRLSLCKAVLAAMTGASWSYN